MVEKEFIIPEYQCMVRGIYLVFYCAHCRLEHFHGLNGQPLGTNFKTHRIAHCKTIEGKQAHPNGYYIFHGPLPKVRQAQI